MPDDYRVSVIIAVYSGPAGTEIVKEEYSYNNLQFQRMTGISAEFYELLKKIEKAMK